MSKHIPRHARWSSHGPSEWRSREGLRVYFVKGAWWADVSYRLRTHAMPGAPPIWEAHTDQLGPYKRPRNAMVEAERYVVLLQNRHADAIAFE